jgi:hypothetical protein
MMFWKIVSLLPMLYSIWLLLVELKKENKDSVRMVVFGGYALLGLVVIKYHVFGEAFESMVAGFIYFALALFSWFATLSKPKEETPISDKHIRGTQRISADELQTKVVSKYPPVTEQITIGGVSIPHALEVQMIFVGGTTGAGKTQCINEILRTARRRKNKAIIADTGCGFYARFGGEGDKVLNPFDKRTADWSPFAEIEFEYDCPRLAKAIIPEGKGDSQEWHHYAQTLVGEVMLAMWHDGNESIKELLHYLTSANSKELAALLAGTPAAILCEKGNEKMLSNTRGIISTYMGTWRYLKEGGTFSVRKWVRDESTDSWLFLTYKDEQLAMLRGLVTTWIEIAVIEGLSLPESSTRRFFYVMDELDTLGKMSALRDGVTKLRKYGGVVVAGLQTIAQIRDTWGHDGAQTLLSCFSTKIIYRAGDGETGEYFEKELGQQELERTTINKSESGGITNDSTNFTRVTQATVLASEIMQLENLHGFIKIPGFDVASFAQPYVGMADKNQPFEAAPRPARRKDAEAEQAEFSISAPDLSK